jgi:hypothetical protein
LRKEFYVSTSLHIRRKRLVNLAPFHVEAIAWWMADIKSFQKRRPAILSRAWFRNLAV